MFFRRFLLILIALSFLSGSLLLLSAAFLIPPGRGRVYAVLVLDDAWPDREIRALLANEAIISESSQRVFLDDFSGLISIPLDEYPKRALPFDPRNDGYAERLRPFFVREGKRFLYIPLERRPGAAGRLETELRLSLGDIPFQVEYSGGGKPVTLSLILMFIAGAGGLWFSRRFLLAPGILPLAGLAFAGAPGFALAAVFMGLAGLLLDPCGEYFIYRRYKKNTPPFGAYEQRSLADLLGPFKSRFLWALVFGVVLIAGSLAGGIHPLVTLGTGAGFMGICFFSCWVFSRRGEDHVRFSPVPILKVPAINLDFSFPMLPYAVAALISFPLSLWFSGPCPAENSFFLKSMPPILREEEYLSHAAFQSAFSLRPLGREPRGEAAYAPYILGDDGLIAERGELSRENNTAGETPPAFPLKDLMAALEDGAVSAAGEAKGPAAGELILVFLALFLSLPALVRLRWMFYPAGLLHLFFYRDEG
jgi:hypothetical protein